MKIYEIVRKESSGRVETPEAGPLSRFRSGSFFWEIH